MHTRIARFICEYLVNYYLNMYNIRIFYFTHVDISVCNLGEFTYSIDLGPQCTTLGAVI
jgi:hypothetical protein